MNFTERRARFFGVGRAADFYMDVFCQSHCSQSCLNLKGNLTFECGLCVAPMECRPGAFGFDGWLGRHHLQKTVALPNELVEEGDILQSIPHPTCLRCKLASTLCRYSSVIANEGQSGVRESHLLSNGILRTSSHQTFDRPGQPSSIGSDLQWALALPTSSRSRR